MKEIILIPSYKPDSQLTKFLEALKNEGLNDVLIVDDGSGEEYKKVYDEVEEKYPKCTIIYHAVNLGKGRALKTGFNYALNNFEEMTGVVACDADGQHPAKTVKQAAEVMREHPNQLILGVRQFLKGKNVPASNFLGNMITIFIFKVLTGLSFGDTQCGLRAFPKSVMKKLIKTAGERFDYENVMLLDVRREKIDYCEIPMEAIYFEEEKQTSHFNKIKDSALIYMNILKFAILPVFAGLVAYFATIAAFAWLPICSLIKTALFYGAGMLAGWLVLLSPVSDERGKWYTILYPIAHSAVFSMAFYWLFNYKAVSFHASWWLCAILAAPIAYVIYLNMRYGKKPKRIKIEASEKN